jgi:P4 family phage/plasmid primase-like protien
MVSKQLNRSESHALLTALAVRFCADRTFANVTQAIRLPGFINGKYGNEVELLDWSDAGRTYDLESLRLAFDVDLVTRHLRSYQPRFTPGLALPKSDVSKEFVLEDAKSALAFIPADGYDVWYRVGMALHALGQDGYDLWVAWSKSSGNFNADEMPAKWKSFDKVRSIGLPTVFSLAAAHGWRNPGFRTTHASDDTGVHGTERAVGRMLAAEMYDQYAAIPSDGRSRHGHLLLRWDGIKYVILTDIERRKVIESFVSEVRNANAKNEAFVKFLVYKSANNRALDDLCEHVCEYLAGDSAACVASSYPYFTVANGVLNLLSRELVPAFLRPLSTVVGRVQYDPTAKAGLFMETLGQIFEGDQEMVRAVLRLFGYILQGNPKEHIFVIFFGPTGRNGKTLTVQVARDVFGDYAQAIPASVILAKSHNNEGPTPAIAKLFGKRLAIISEPGDKHPLDSGFIKLMTGGEHITARQLHGPMLEFMPEFVPVMVTNKIPAVHDDDHALWRRMKIVKFTRTFSDEEIDSDLKDKLVTEVSGILNLFLDGIEDYRANGLKWPTKIASAGLEQRKEFDPFEAWHEECALVAEKANETSLQDLSASYEGWAQANRQYRRLTKKELSSKLTARGYEKVDRRRYPHFCGVLIKEKLES